MEELDTPALVVDIDVLQQNIDTVHGVFRHLRPDGVTPEVDSMVRPHVSCHGCPQIAQLQVSADPAFSEEPPSCSGAIAVNTVSEAEAFAAAGFDDILISGRVVTLSKIRRAMTLARNIWVFQAVDNHRNVQDLSLAAEAEDVVLGVVVDIDSGYGHGGVAPGDEAVRLAQAVEDAPGLALMGVTTYEGPLPFPNLTELRTETRNRIRPVLETVQQMERAGLEVPVVSAGSTHNYDVAARMTGVSEVLAGTYAADGRPDPSNTTGTATRCQDSFHGHQPSRTGEGGCGRWAQNHGPRFWCRSPGRGSRSHRHSLQRRARHPGA